MTVEIHSKKKMLNLKLFDNLDTLQNMLAEKYLEEQQLLF